MRVWARKVLSSKEAGTGGGGAKGRGRRARRRSLPPARNTVATPCQRRPSLVVAMGRWTRTKYPEQQGRKTRMGAGTHWGCVCIGRSSRSRDRRRGVVSAPRGRRQTAAGARTPGSRAPRPTFCAGSTVAVMLGCVWMCGCGRAERGPIRRSAAGVGRAAHFRTRFERDQLKIAMRHRTAAHLLHRLEPAANAPRARAEQRARRLEARGRRRRAAVARDGHRVFLGSGTRRRGIV